MGMTRRALLLSKQFVILSSLIFTGAAATAFGITDLVAYQNIYCPLPTSCPAGDPGGGVTGILWAGLGVFLMVLAVWLFTRWYPRQSHDQVTSDK
jgi:sterol desaturase/sphingolipid hydroxylase (fatty acid hydroxylase superfamily)